MKFGSLQGVLGEPLPQVFVVAAQLGFDGVELDWREPSEADADGPLGPEHRARLRQAARAAGVEICSVAAHFLNRGGLATEDPAQRDIGMRAVRAGVALCRDLGAKVLLVPFFGPAELDGPDAIARLTASLKRLAPEAESAGVTLGVESTLSAHDVVKMLASVGSPRVAAYWDMGNCMCCGYDPREEIELLRGRLAQVHAKEFDGRGCKWPRPPRSYPGLNPKPLGEGQVPVREVVTALRRGGYEHYIVLETGAFGDRRASAKAALGVLRAAVQSA